MSRELKSLKITFLKDSKSPKISKILHFDSNYVKLKTKIFPPKRFLKAKLSDL